MDSILDYTIRILPALLLVAIAFAITPRKEIALRILLLVLGFILMRDAMTPLGYWQFGTTVDPLPSLWLRFIDNPLILITFAVASLLVTAMILVANKDLYGLVKWGKPGRLSTYAVGLAGAAVIAAPFLLLYMFIPLEQRGGDFAAVALPALLLMFIFGNLMEEVLFRGFIQGYLEKLYGAVKALVLSALLFAIGHMFLASTVTSIGFPILLFTLYEGLVCGYVRNKSGVIASTVSHGLAIFILASALI